MWTCATSLCGASSSRPSGLLSASCPLPRRFPLAFLPANSYPFCSWLQVVVCSFLSSCQVLPQETLTPFTTHPCWAHTMRWSQHGYLSQIMLRAACSAPSIRAAHLERSAEI